MNISVIKTGGKQYRVWPGLKLKVEKLEGDAGVAVEFDNVLLSADDKGEKVEVGAPVIEGAKVLAKIVRQGRGKKVRVEKFKSKVRYHKVYGHRQAFTEVEIA
jgi:large subunit ribosomal protein L21